LFILFVLIHILIVNELSLALFCYTDFVHVAPSILLSTLEVHIQIYVYGPVVILVL